MDWWSALEGVLGCQPGNEQLHRIVLILGALASAATVFAAVYRLWRWLVGPSQRHRLAARALREQGKYHARLNHQKQALELYDLSARLNPRSAEVYYLRGCLKEELEQINRAVADWKRCVHRLPTHAAAIQKLAQYGVAETGSCWPSWAIATGAGMGAVVVVVLASVYAL
jgi:tetratricopeptide (TPR) repeat protein